MRRLLVATVLMICLCLPATVGAASSRLVSYHRTGGIAGQDVRLTVSRAGRATLAGGPSHTVSARTMKRLRHALNVAHVERAVPKPSGACADCFVTTIAYKGHSLRVIEQSVPARLRDAISLLAKIAAGGS